MWRIQLRPNSLVVLGLILGASYWVFESAVHALLLGLGPFVKELVPDDPHELWMRAVISLMFIGFGAIAGRSAYRLEQQQRFTDSMTKTLGTYVPICAYCKKVREEDAWIQVELFVTRRAGGTSFSHGICPECSEREFPGPGGGLIAEDS